jgi:hypothetical protein
VSAALFFCLDCHRRYTILPYLCACGAYGLIVPYGERPKTLVETVPEVTTAHVLATRAWKRVPVRAYDIELAPGALVTVTGDPGNGKSSWAGRAADSMPGPVVLASYEEPPGPSLAARLARCAIKRDDFFVVGDCGVDDLAKLINDRRAIALVVDSVQISPFRRARDLRHLLVVLPNLLTIIAVAQANKAGAISGSNELAHESDVIVHCEEMSWVVTKSRYESTPTPPRRVLVESIDQGGLR